MLSREDNELLCRVGRGTPMGELMRQYWIPCLPSNEFPEPDSPVKRMTLLGENFVMFRDSEGRMGALSEACPHRGASMYFGRNEECGLRCVYHGWKFDIHGNCVDMPSEPPESNYKDKVRARAYPCHEVNHMIWVYLGERETPPPFPAFEINTLPEDRVGTPLIMMEEANFMQNLEGDIDTVHLDWVHAKLHKDAPYAGAGVPGFWNDDKRPPRLDIIPTDYGAFYSAMRTTEDGQDWHRINQFIFPFHTMISSGTHCVLRSFVPIDDEWTMLIAHNGQPGQGPISAELRRRWDLSADPFKDWYGYAPRTNDPRSYFYTVANRHNDYMIDPKIAKESLNIGMPFIANLQDRAMTELMMGPNGEHIYDRTQEHLGTSDAMIIAVRKKMIEAAKRYAASGELPPNVDDVNLDRIRCATLILEKGVDWVKASDAARAVDESRPLTFEHHLVPAA